MLNKIFLMKLFPLDKEETKILIKKSLKEYDDNKKRVYNDKIYEKMIYKNIYCNDKSTLELNITLMVCFILLPFLLFLIKIIFFLV